MSMRVRKPAFILTNLVRIIDLARTASPRPYLGGYIIQGIAVIPPRPRLDGTGRKHLHPVGGGIQFEAKMNFQRPARSSF
jgi:hypothetical protein